MMGPHFELHCSFIPPFTCSPAPVLRDWLQAALPCTCYSRGRLFGAASFAHSGLSGSASPTGLFRLWKPPVRISAGPVRGSYARMRHSEEGRRVAAEVIPEFKSAQVLSAPKQCVTETQQRQDPPTESPISQKKPFLASQPRHDLIPRVLTFLRLFF